ncbi:MAG: DM13 domain-containing protein [Litorimonas sp.]
MKIRNITFILGLAVFSSLSTISALPAFAQTTTEVAVVEAVKTVENQEFFKKKYRIKGTWSLTERDGKHFITFSDDFKTKNGPDLKIFLSPKSTADVNGKNAIDGAVNIGVLKSNKGSQEYEIPADVNLSQFSTVLVHCEAYSILWGGGAL